jgi:hypothetical protein
MSSDLSVGMPAARMITADDAEEYTQALGQVMAGGWRQRELAWRLGVPQALGMSLQQWTAERLGGYVRQSIPERREAVAELTEDGLTTREIGEVLGVDHKTVVGDRRSLAGENSPTDAVPAAEPEADAGENSPSQTHVTHNSGDVEWFTPSSYIEAGRVVLGGIDLDPASSAAANEVVQADQYYDQTSDGLTQPWTGRVWMNPPYSGGLVDKFCDRITSSYTNGSVTAACVLVNNATETNWFQTVARVAAAICFTRGRIRFWHPEKPSITPLQGQAILYLGDHTTLFRTEFAQFGLVVTCR